MTNAWRFYTALEAACLDAPLFACTPLIISSVQIAEYSKNLDFEDDM
jgi:hypothetical protein